jgi:hypothetical protein
MPAKAEKKPEWPSILFAFARVEVAFDSSDQREDSYGPVADARFPLRGRPFRFRRTRPSPVATRVVGTEV